MAEKKVIELEVKTNTKAVNDEFKETSTSIKRISEDVKDLKKNSENAENGIKKISNGIKGIGLAFKAAGIGLIIGAFNLLTDVFTQNQKVADTLSSVFETISIVFNEVAKVVTNVYQRVDKATGGFNALGKVLGGLITLVLTPLKASFYGIKLGIQEAQLIWEKSFFGNKDQINIKNLQKEIRTTQKDIIGVGTDALQAGKDIGKNFVEAVGEVGQLVSETAKGISEVSVKSAFEQAKLNVAIQNAAKIAAAQQSILIEKYDRAAEKLRQVRDEERNSIEERVQANNNLGIVLEKQQRALLKQADLQVAAAKNEYNKSKNIESQVALLEAQANREGILAQVEGLRSEQLVNDLALNREKLELNQSNIDSETELANRQKRFDAERIKDEHTQLNTLIDVVEQEKKVELLRLQNKIDSYKLGTQLRLDAQSEYNTKSQELDNELTTLKDKRLEVEGQKSREFYEGLMTSNKIQSDNDKALQDAKIQVVKNGFDTIGNLAQAFAGKSEKAQKRAFEIQKAANIANTLIDTYQSATSSYKSLAGIPYVGPALGFIAAGAAVAAGLANVKNIANQQFGDRTLKSSNTPSANTPSLTQQPPTFNVIGQTAQTQIAQSQQPIRAFVVSNEVTTQQALDRNRLRNATL